MSNFHKDGVNDEKTLIFLGFTQKFNFQWGQGVNEKPKSSEKLQSMSMSWHKLRLVHLTVNAENLV